MSHHWKHDMLKPQENCILVSTQQCPGCETAFSTFPPVPRPPPSQSLHPPLRIPAPTDRHKVDSSVGILRLLLRSFLFPSGGWHSTNPSVGPCSEHELQLFASLFLGDPAHFEGLPQEESNLRIRGPCAPSCGSFVRMPWNDIPIFWNIPGICRRFGSFLNCLVLRLDLHYFFISFAFYLVLEWKSSNEQTLLRWSPTVASHSGMQLSVKPEVMRAQQTCVRLGQATGCQMDPQRLVVLIVVRGTASTRTRVGVLQCHLLSP
jgi:hypothetical protein